MEELEKLGTSNSPALLAGRLAGLYPLDLTAWWFGRYHRYAHGRTLYDAVNLAIVTTDLKRESHDVAAGTDRVPCEYLPGSLIVRLFPPLERIYIIGSDKTAL